MKYYFMQCTTQTHGLEYVQSMVTQSRKKITHDEAEDIALAYLGHEDSWEIFKLRRLDEITKSEMEILKKFL